MKIQAFDEAGNLIWSRGPVGGVTSHSYGADGTLQQVEQALVLALAQCRGELAVAVDRDRVSETG
jgi:hypothetical protein